MNGIVTFYDENISDQFDHIGLKVLENISNLQGVTSPVTALPDFHLKKGMESPSSISVGVKNGLIPHLTSSSVNCGMGAIVTSLTEDDIYKKISEFYNLIRQNRSNKSYVLTKHELFDVLIRGASALSERYSIATDTIRSFENRGKVDGLDEIGLNGVMSYIPRGVLNHSEYSGMTELGIGFGGNHFLEIQKVADIYDRDVCSANNIVEPGQIIVMYHGGGGIIPGFLGGYFARRTKGYNQNFRHVMNKLEYHLKRVNGLRSLPEMYRYYFSPQSYVMVNERTHEGKRFIHANTMGMNYGYAYRLFMIIRVRDALRKIFGSVADDIHLIRDVSHNSIQKEVINSEELWIHRHNSARIKKGGLALLPGYNNTSSYICEGLDNTAATLNTVPHGAGDSIKAYRNAGISKVVEGRCTEIYRNRKSEPEHVEHHTDEGVDAVVNLLQQNGIMRPIARTTPLAVLKDYR